MICAEVWGLYRTAIALFPKAATMIERDDEIPAVEWLLAELDQARAIAGRARVSVN